MPFATISRALIILSTAIGLQFSSWHLPIALPFQWNYWVMANVALLLVTPLLLGYVLLSDPPQEFGVRVGEWRLGLRWALGLFAASLPVLIIASRLPEVQQFYRLRYLPRVSTGGDLLLLTMTTAMYLIAWEFFFRGFLLFGLRPALTGYAILVQAVLFMVGHYGKPMPEFAGSFVAGLALGGVCWRTGAFWPAFVTHALSHVTFNVLVLS